MRTSPIAPLFVLITLAFVPFGTLTAQVQQEWLARYDAAAHQDTAQRMTLDGAGNIVILGYIQDTPGFGTLKTLKYDPQGALLWDRSFGSSASWVIGGLAVDASGNVVISATPSTTNQILTVKYDAAGNEVWVRDFDPFGCGGGSAGGVAVDASGNVYVAGTFVDCQAPNSGTGHLGTAKFDPAGNALWTVAKRSKRGDSGYPRRLVTDAQGNLYMAGYVYYGPTRTSSAVDILAMRYDSDGREHWTRRVRYGMGVDLDMSGPDTLILGATSLVSGIETNFVVLGFSADNGRALWTTTLDSGQRDDLQAIAIRGGEVYACGWSTEPDLTDSDFLVARVSQSGVAWSRRFDGGTHDQCNDIAVDASGNAYATGVTQPQDSYLDFTTLKYDPTGILVWSEHYNGPDIPIPADEAIAVAVTSANEVIVTGSSTAVNQLSDIVTIKYGQP
jgi:hypothetical protein